MDSGHLIPKNPVRLQKAFYIHDGIKNIFSSDNADGGQLKAIF